MVISKHSNGIISIFSGEILIALLWNIIRFVWDVRQRCKMYQWKVVWLCDDWMWRFCVCLGVLRMREYTHLYRFDTSICCAHVCVRVSKRTRANIRVNCAFVYVKKFFFPYVHVCVRVSNSWKEIIRYRTITLAVEHTHAPTQTHICLWPYDCSPYTRKHHTISVSSKKNSGTKSERERATSEITSASNWQKSSDKWWKK